MAEHSLGKYPGTQTGVILIPPAGVPLPVSVQHGSTGRYWDVLIGCLKAAGPTADSCGKSVILTALIWNSVQRAGKAGVPAGRTDRWHWIKANVSIPSSFLWGGICPGRKTKTAALVEAHPSYCMGEVSEPSVLSHLTVLEAAGAPLNTINLNLTLTWPLRTTHPERFWPKCTSISIRLPPELPLFVITLENCHFSGL